jgi:hypothetical protein
LTAQVSVVGSSIPLPNPVSATPSVMTVTDVLVESDPGQGGRAAAVADESGQPCAEGRLPTNAQRRPAGSQDPQLRARAEQDVGQYRDCLHQVLAIQRRQQRAT